RQPGRGVQSGRHPVERRQDPRGEGAVRAGREARSEHGRRALLARHGADQRRRYGGGEAAFRDVSEARADGPVRRNGEIHRRVHQVSQSTPTSAVTDPNGARVIPANLAAIRERIAAAAVACGRPPGDVRVLAVSKTFGAAHVRAAHAAGQRDFGENKVQEALQKREETADLEIRWHLIGHLQSNKAKKAAPAFAAIHSIDSVDLLRRVDTAAEDAGATPDLYIQVDLAGESTKFGAPEGDVPGIARAAMTCRA